MVTQGTPWCVLLLGIGIVGAAAHAADQPQRLRIAVFNIWELDQAKLRRGLPAPAGTDPQARGAAEIIQRVRPDILLVNEIDYNPDDPNPISLFAERYLGVPQNDQPPMKYPYRFTGPVNTGVPTGHDLDNDGRSDGPGDAYGYGKYPGQYGMAVLSRFPIDHADLRSFQLLPWTAMPDHLLPDGAGGKPAWYSPAEARLMRLSSKSHWDLPVRIGDRRLHLLCAHPTPPVFDGDEDRNGRRNFDEIRLFADYLAGGQRARYIVDDQDRRGGLDPRALVVVIGDLNAEPFKADADYGRPAIRQLLDHPRLQDPAPRSPGAAGNEPTGAPAHPERKTCNFGRIDYVLPSRELTVLASGVFWPAKGQPQARLVASRENSSDHRLVWVDLALPLGR